MDTTRILVDALAFGLDEADRGKVTQLSRERSQLRAIDGNQIASLRGDQRSQIGNCYRQVLNGKVCGELGCSGWSRCTQVSRKIAEREIRLMTDTADDRDIRRGDCSHHALIIERPQVFDGTAAACHDNYIGRLEIESVNGFD